jgi:hypothetical protein
MTSLMKYPKGNDVNSKAIKVTLNGATIMCFRLINYARKNPEALF